MTEPKIDVLKESMMKYAPQLEEDYKEYVRKTFKEMTDNLGANLEGVYDSPRWARTFSGIRSSLSNNIVNYRTVSYSMDEKALDRDAKRYGESVALAWYNKMRSKLGMLDDVTVSDPRRGGEVTIEGHYKDNKVAVLQHPIINVSIYGKPFHQFPARIYVNGEPLSENQYKKTLQGWGVKEIPRETKPKRPVIDVNSRPKRYTFEFQKEYIGTPSMPHNYGRIVMATESARGMSESEAQTKVEKDEMRYGNYKRVFGFKLISVRAWNDRLLWKRESEDDNPPLEFDSTIVQQRRPARRFRRMHPARSPSTESVRTLGGIRGKAG